MPQCSSEHRRGRGTLPAKSESDLSAAGVSGICPVNIVRVKGLEPIRTKAPDPKSGLATNYNTPASAQPKLAEHANIHKNEVASKQQHTQTAPHPNSTTPEQHRTRSTASAYFFLLFRSQRSNRRSLIDASYSFIILVMSSEVELRAAETSASSSSCCS